MSYLVILLTLTTFSLVSPQNSPSTAALVPLKLSAPKKPAKKELNLDVILHRAYQNRTDLKALQFNTEAYRFNQVQKLSSYLPHVHFSSHHSITKNTPDPLYSIPPYTQKISAQQLIYRFAHPFDQYAIAKKDTQAALIMENLRKDSIRNETENIFLQAWLAQQQHAQVKTRSASARQTFERDKKLEDLNLMNRNDWLKKNVTYITTISEASLHEENLRILQSTLERIINRRLPGTLNIKEHHAKNLPFIALTWDPYSPMHLLPLSDYLKMAYKNRKELLIKQKEIERENALKKFELKHYLPTISLTGEIERIPRTQTQRSLVYKNVGISLNWTLFDGLSHYYDYQAANARMMRASMELASLKNQINQEVETAYYQIKQHLKLLNASHAEYLQAKNEYELYKKQFSLGLTAHPEIHTALFNKENAYYSWLNQRVYAESKFKNLLFACGYPPELN